MNMKKLFSVAIFASTAFVQANGDACVPSPTFVARTQQRKMYQNVGEVGHVHLYDMECLYGTVSLLGGYTRSFRPGDIAKCLFGPSLLNDCNCPGRTISIQGSGVANRNSQAWLADYFYLPTDFNGSITFDPRITNGILNIDFFLGLNEWLCGLYLRIFGPIVHTKWDLNFCELTPDNAGTASSVAGYFTPNGLSRSQLNPNATAYFTGQSLPNSTGNVVDGVTFTPLQRSLFCCSNSKTGFADLRVELGWDFWQCEDWHLGANIQFAAPTGSRRDCCCLFEPVVGNGKHWELGGGFTGHYVFWRSCEEDRNFGFYVDANFLHLFKATECRSFDLCGKPNSRYMLAQQLGPISNDLSGATTSSETLPVVNDNANAQFANVFVPVANLTCIPVRVSVGVQTEIVAWFNYTSCNFSWDFGYDFWGRSCEKMSCSDNCNDCNASCPSLLNSPQTYALKGDARVFGFLSTTGEARALSATESQATIRTGTNATNATSGAARLNLGVDNARFAYADGVRLLDSPTSANLEANQINTSIQPQFLTANSIAYVRNRGISHTVFTHFQYTWDCECWIPYLGVGGFAEFGRHCDSDNCNTNSCCPPIGSTTITAGCNTTCNIDLGCSPCSDCALSQWAVWVKAGLSFN